MKIRIILADDHKIVRNGLRSLISQEDDMLIIAEAEDGKSAVQLSRELSPDIVIMDIAMPIMNGMEATRQIVAATPHCKVIALSMHSDSRYIAEMLKAGASGYLLKDCAFEELCCAIHAVITHRIYLSPQISDIVIDDYVKFQQKNDGTVFSLLSAREREVLQLLSEGKSTIFIAEHLCLSVKTIETHRQNIMSKLSVRSVAELTKYAIREGLTSL
jgi:two-component system, NarL family, response regulator NreC